MRLFRRLSVGITMDFGLRWNNEGRNIRERWYLAALPSPWFQVPIYSSIALLILLLTSCATAPSKIPTTKPIDPIASVQLPMPELPQASVSLLENTDVISPWQRLRQRFAMPGCDYRPQVLRWAQRYTAGPDQFAASLRRAMPFLLIVLDELERRDLPGEFAFLPYLESQYIPVPSQGNRPAGIWQLMPGTARLQGLSISGEYDGRLDVTASTTAALGLIDDYQKKFGDWRLANMAFNAGEYRVKRLLAGRDANDLSAYSLSKLPLASGTHEHLDKLLALACVISDPTRFNVDLPEPEPSDRLERISLQTPIDLRLAANFADMDLPQLRRFNAAYRGIGMPDSAPYELLLPIDRISLFQNEASSMPTPLWRNWSEIPLKQPTTLSNLAANLNITAENLASANSIDSDALLPAGTKILLPGQQQTKPSNAAQEKPAAHVHIVRAGDTLLGIAHRYGLRLAQLLHWNAFSHTSLLRIGDRIVISAPHAK